MDNNLYQPTHPPIYTSLSWSMLNQYNHSTTRPTSSPTYLSTPAYDDPYWSKNNYYNQWPPTCTNPHIHLFTPAWADPDWSRLIQAYSVQPWPCKKYHLTHSTYLQQLWPIQTDPSLSRKATALQDVPTHPSIYLHQPQPIQTDPHLISTAPALQEVLSHL